MLRELRAEDAEAVAAIIRAADSSRGIDADEVRSWLDHAALDPEEVRVLELGGEVVGYVDLLRSEELANVDPSGPGHEGALLDWAETRAREGGAEQTRVHVSEHNVSLADTLRARRYGPAVAAARPRRGAAPARVPRPARAGASPRRARRRRREPDRGDAALRTRRHARGRTLRDVEQEALTPPRGYTARAPNVDDASGVAGLLRETELRDFGDAEADAVELARDWETFDLVRDAVVVCHDDGTAVGYGYFFRRGVQQAIIDVYVHPAHTGRGIGTYLVSELERRSGNVERIGSGIPASNDAGRTLLEERGYRMVRRFWRMTIDLDRHPPAPVWPEGTLPTRYLPRDDQAIWAAVEEAFEDHWEYRPEPFEEWRRRSIERQGFDPTLWIVAKDGPEVAGVVLAREEPEAGRIDTLAVRRAWRRRGLGRALTLEAFGEFHRRGRHTIVLNVDSENLTGATHLYEQAGMRVTREIDAYERVLR